NVARCLPKLCLYAYRPISVPDFECVLVTTQSRLRLSQSCGDLRPGESARALRVKWMVDKILSSRIAQLYNDRWIDRLDINERAISICVDRHEKCRQRNKQPNLVVRSVHRCLVLCHASFAHLCPGAAFPEKPCTAV